jgi:hypothetical protein
VRLTVRVTNWGPAGGVVTVSIADGPVGTIGPLAAGQTNSTEFDVDPEGWRLATLPGQGPRGFTEFRPGGTNVTITGEGSPGESVTHELPLAGPREVFLEFQGTPFQGGVRFDLVGVAVPVLPSAATPGAAAAAPVPAAKTRPADPGGTPAPRIITAPAAAIPAPFTAAEPDGPSAGAGAPAAPQVTPAARPPGGSAATRPGRGAGAG